MTDLGRRGFLGGVIAATVAPAAARVSVGEVWPPIRFIDLEIRAPTLGEWLAEMQRPRWTLDGS